MLSSPSGGGKSTIARHLLAARDDLAYSVSATTRQQREGEKDGQHYHFLDRPVFERKVQAQEFVEWAEYGGQLYGTLRVEVEKGLAAGKQVVLDIEVVGARQVRERFPNSVHVFVLPPSAQALVQRLRERNTETPEALASRVSIAAEELGEIATYDYAIVNDDVVEAVAQVAAILDAESRRVRRCPNLEQVITTLRQELAGHAERLRLEPGHRKD